MTPTKIVLHDSDHKAMMLGEGGQLSYYDLVTMKIVEEYVLQVLRVGDRGSRGCLSREEIGRARLLQHVFGTY